jgi:hypothetical protein
MKHVFLICIATYALTLWLLSVLLPAQQLVANKKAKEDQKSQWVEAASACSSAAQGNVTTSMDASGVVYCISQTGKLLATIADTTKENPHQSKP